MNFEVLFVTLTCGEYFQCNVFFIRKIKVSKENDFRRSVQVAPVTHEGSGREEGREKGEGA